MRVHLIPFAPVRMDRQKCMEHAKTCFLLRRRYPNCEHLMWEWLLRWAGAPV